MINDQDDSPIRVFWSSDLLQWSRPEVLLYALANNRYHACLETRIEVTQSAADRGLTVNGCTLPSIIARHHSILSLYISLLLLTLIFAASFPVSTRVSNSRVLGAEHDS